MAEPKSSQRGAPAKAGSRQRSQKDSEPDLELLVNELDQRVDRLRAAYDQYFMGIEKIPPHVQLKEVERRLQELRKQQIRNTALRFKFQTILQKYNTYQSYWQRIVRQIEEGTYKRDIRRATERFNGSKRGRDVEIDVEVGELEAEDYAEIEALLEETLPRGDSAPPGPAPSEEPRPPLLLTLDDPDADIPLPPRSAPPPPFPPPQAAAPPRTRLFRTTPLPPAPPAPVSTPTGPGRPAAAEAPPGARPSTVPPRPAVPASPPPPRPASPAVRPLGGATGRAIIRPKQAPAVAAASAGAVSPPTAVASPPRGGPAVPPVVVPRQAAPEPPKPRPTASAPSSPPPRPSPRREDLSDERLRQLYGQYIEAKRARQESTASLTYDSLAKSLRESSAKLKEKHAGKAVDFEVAIKDGKTVLRPVVRDKI